MSIEFSIFKCRKGNVATDSALMQVFYVVLGIFVLFTFSKLYFTFMALGGTDNSDVADQNAKSIGEFKDYFSSGVYSGLNNCYNILKLDNLENYQTYDKDKIDNYFLVISKDGIYRISFNQRDEFFNEFDLNLGKRIVEFDPEVILKYDDTDKGNSWLTTFGLGKSDIKLNLIEDVQMYILEPILEENLVDETIADKNQYKIWYIKGGENFKELQDRLEGNNFKKVSICEDKDSCIKVLNVYGLTIIDNKLSKLNQNNNLKDEGIEDLKGNSFNLNNETHYLEGGLIYRNEKYSRFSDANLGLLNVGLENIYPNLVYSNTDNSFFVPKNEYSNALVMANLCSYNKYMKETWDEIYSYNNGRNVDFTNNDVIFKMSYTDTSNKDGQMIFADEIFKWEGKPVCKKGENNVMCSQLFNGKTIESYYDFINEIEKYFKENYGNKINNGQMILNIETTPLDIKVIPITSEDINSRQNIKILERDVFEMKSTINLDINEEQKCFEEVKSNEKIINFEENNQGKNNCDILIKTYVKEPNDGEDYYLLEFITVEGDDLNFIDGQTLFKFKKQNKFLEISNNPILQDYSYEGNLCLINGVDEKGDTFLINYLEKEILTKNEIECEKEKTIEALTFEEAYRYKINYVEGRWSDSNEKINNCKENECIRVLYEDNNDVIFYIKGDEGNREYGKFNERLLQKERDGKGGFNFYFHGNKLKIKYYDNPKTKEYNSLTGINGGREEINPNKVYVLKGINLINDKGDGNTYDIVLSQSQVNRISNVVIEE